MRLLKTLLILTLSLTSLMTSAKTYHVYFLGGQSNMEGYGYNAELSDDQKALSSAVPIFHGRSVFDNQADGGVGLWSLLKPGHGTGFHSDGVTNNYSDRFGPELTFAQSMAKSTAQNIAIIKYATGGTGLSTGVGYGNWDPEFTEGDGQNQYDYALTAIKTALTATDIDGDGVPDTLIPAGIVWMQGEADAHHSVAAADAYGEKLTTLMKLIRQALGDETIPVVLGKINRRPDQGAEPEMPYMQTVIKAQKLFAMNDVCARYVTETEKYTLTDDRWHYDSAAYIQMGQAFAKAMLNLKTC
ncbi:MAG: sialate O-acetylesterase [Gammaproteobacteria bacterium]